MVKLFCIIVLIFPIFMQSKTLNIVTIDFPPYAFKQNGKVIGFNVEILNHIFSKLNIKIKYHILPWARAVKMIKHGEADAIFPFFKNKKREVFTDYPHSFTSEPIAMFVLKNSNIIYKGNLSQLSSYTFGRVRAYSSGETFDAAVKRGIFQLEIANNSEQNLKKFFRKRFDILVDNKYYVLSSLKRLNKLGEVRQLKPILTDNSAYLGFSKSLNHSEIINNFNSILKSMHEDGSYNKILKSYFSK